MKNYKAEVSTHSWSGGAAKVMWLLITSNRLTFKTASRFWDIIFAPDCVFLLNLHPLLIFRESLLLWAPEAGSQARIPVAELGSAKVLHSSSLPGRGKWQWGMGTGATSWRAMVTSPATALSPLGQRKKRRRWWRCCSQQERGGRKRDYCWGFSLLFTHDLLSHRGWCHIPRPYFVHISPPPDAGLSSS